MKDRRRRRIAVENPAKEMQRYLDNGDDVKVGITVLQERLEVLVHGQKIFEVFWQEEE